MSESALRPPPPPELMDGDELSLGETARALEDLRLTNRRLLGYRPVLRSLLPDLADGDCILDLGSGSGDVAAAVVRGGGRRRRSFRVISVDFKLRHLVLGRGRFPDQMRVVASAEALPFAAEAVDWSFSSLFFHHFGSERNRKILREMQRVSRRGATVIDLRRSFLLRSLIRSILRFVVRAGPVASVDGTISVRESWSMKEVRHFARALPGAQLCRRFPFRFALRLPSLLKPLDLEK